jgi:hypothetical protein
MATFRTFMHRFLRLLPFLTTPNSYRRFYYDYWLPYPDVWNDTERSPHPAIRSSSQPGRDKLPAQGLSRNVHPYVRWMEFRQGPIHRREPFL